MKEIWIMESLANAFGAISSAQAIEKKKISLVLFPNIEDLVVRSELKYSGSLTGIQSSFVTANGTVWMVKDNSTAVPVVGGEAETAVSFGHSTGHANSSQYANGLAYISDWTDGTLIHVFEVCVVFPIGALLGTKITAGNPIWAA